MAKQKGALPEVEALGTILAALAELDGPQRTWVLASVAAKLEIAIPNLAGAPRPAGANALLAGSGAAIPGHPGTNAHAKAFLRAKNPTNTVQRVACLAYYLTHYRATPEFKTRDISKMNSDAAGTSIGNPSQAVANATKQSKYLAAAGRGKKQLTGFGEEVVNALPNIEAVAALEKAEPARKRRKARRKKRA
jgi:hypothetical protein